jgi:hypothetical protein
LEKRIEALEQRMKAAASGIEGIFRIIIDPQSPDAPVCRAECDGLHFQAEAGETEEHFRARVAAAIPKRPGRVWRAVMYSTP